MSQTEPHNFWKKSERKAVFYSEADKTDFTPLMKPGGAEGRMAPPPCLSSVLNTWLQVTRQRSWGCRWSHCSAADSNIQTSIRRTFNLEERGGGVRVRGGDLRKNASQDWQVRRPRKGWALSVAATGSCKAWLTPGEPLRLLSPGP